MEKLIIEEQFGMKGLSFSKSLNTFLESFPKDQAIKVLDLGCGYGQKALFMAAGGWEVSALDLDPEKLSFLQQRAEEFNMPIQTIEGDITGLPIPDGEFDAVICCSAIHHQKMAGIVKTLAEILRVLKPGGRVFFDILSDKDPSYALGEEIEAGTMLGGREGEEDVPHHYSTREEVEKILADYSRADISESEFSYEYNKEKFSCVLFEVVAVK